MNQMFMMLFFSMIQPQIQHTSNEKMHISHQVFKNNDEKLLLHIQQKILLKIQKIEQLLLKKMFKMNIQKRLLFYLLTLY